MATIEATPEAIVANDIEPGDKVTLIFRNGRHEKITVDTVDESSIAGTDENDELVAADFRDLRKIKARKFDGRKTAENTGKGVLLVAVGLLWVVGMAAQGMAEGYGK